MTCFTIKNIEIEMVERIDSISTYLKLNPISTSVMTFTGMM